eukprot:2728172-Alexandrium_andersonii.AAC.1
MVQQAKMLADSALGHAQCGHASGRSILTFGSARIRRRGRCAMCVKHTLSTTATQRKHSDI